MFFVHWSYIVLRNNHSCKSANNLKSRFGWIDEKKIILVPNHLKATLFKQKLRWWGILFVLLCKLRSKICYILFTNQPRFFSISCNFSGKASYSEVGKNEEWAIIINFSKITPKHLRKNGIFCKPNWVHTDRNLTSTGIIDLLYVQSN